MSHTQGETANHETRCRCGQLLLKRLERGIEIKCKRCKRVQVVPYGSIKGWEAPSP